MLPLLPLLPYPLARSLLADPRRSPLEHTDRFAAVVLFADIAGFTALSDTLSVDGTRGTEELNALLNEYFSAMIGLIESYGGMVCGFGGDALTALFPGADSDAAGRAVTCALAMQAALSSAAGVRTSLGTFPLTMKIGLAAGPVVCASAGDPALRLVPIVAGPPLVASAAAEQRAEPGEIVATAALLDLLSPPTGSPSGSPGAVLAEFRQEGYGWISALAGDSGTPWVTDASPWGHAPLPPLALAGGALGDPGGPLGAGSAAPLFLAYIHPAIAARLGESAEHFINEHRVVTVLFMRFSDSNEVSESAIADLQAYVATVSALSLRYDGFLAQVAIGDKGSTAMILFGAPIAHENDPLRALRCALELRQSSASAGRGVAIGVNTGSVYCGMLGSPTRREYTTIGGAINVAARLMETAASRGDPRLAEGRIIVAQSTAQRASAGFSWEALPPLSLKGKAEPVQALALLGTAETSAVRLQEPSYTLPLVGRTAELERLEALYKTVLGGRGRIAALVGEAGLGKSRLIAEVLRRCGDLGFSAYGGECQSYGTATPYLVWTPIWRAFFGLESNWPPEFQARMLSMQIELIDSQLANQAPLLGPVFNLHLEPNETTSMLDPQVQKSARETLLVRCLRARARHQPLVIVLEDCHWIDQLSSDMLLAIGRAIADVPVLLVLAFRPGVTDPTLGQGLPQLRSWSEIPLGEFTPAEAEQLMLLKLREFAGAVHAAQAAPVAVSAAVATRLIAQAQGNPFYMEELLNYLNDRGIGIDDVAAIEAMELPDSLSNLILSRIDQLNERQQLTIKIASIIGRLFKLRWLLGVYPNLGDIDLVRRDLDELSRLDLTPLDTPEPDVTYLFKHIVTHEVAYESLAHATRARLHEQFASFMEASHAGDPKYLDVLAYHFGRSANDAKKREYLWQAGLAAQAAYANEAALQFYTQLLPLLPAAEQIAVLLRMGDVLQIVGRPGEAIACYGRVLPETGEPATRGRCQLAIGKVRGELGQFDDARAWLEQARATYQSIGDQAGVAQALVEIAAIDWQQGRYAEGVAILRESLEFWRSLGDSLGQAKTLFQLGVIVSDQRRYAEARAYHEEGLALRRAAGDLFAVASSLNDLGIIAFDTGDYAAAQRLYAEAFAIRRDLGFKRGMAQSLSNLSNAAYASGDYRRTKELLEEAIVYRREVGHQRGVAISLAHLGNVHAALGDLEEAWRYHEQSLAVREQIKHTPGIAQSLIAMGYVALWGGDAARAAGLFQRSLAMFESLDDGRGLAETAVGLGCVAVLRGDYPAAASLFAAAAAALDRLQIIFEPEYLTVSARLRDRLRAADPAGLAEWSAAGAAMDAADMLAAARKITP